MKIAFFGAGAIGASVGAWVAKNNPDTYFIDQGLFAEAIQKNGIDTYLGEDKNNTLEHVSAKLMPNLKDLVDMDIIVLGIKNYSLESVSKIIRENIGTKEPIILAMANGHKNQEILPKFFKRIIYCVVSFNAWVDTKPGTSHIVGYQKKGPLIIGTPDNSLQEELKIVADIFNRGVETVITPHLEDAVHCKMVINLTNSLTTLVGHNYGTTQISDISIFQNLLSSTLWEGIQILKKAGYHECRLGGMPSWSKIKIGATFPQFITRKIFLSNVKKMVLASMAQDILVYKRKSSELDDLNGYFINLADKLGMKIPFNRAIFKLASDKFKDPEHFVPMDVKEVYQHVLMEK